MANVGEIDSHLIKLDNHKDPKKVPNKLIDTKNWRRLMELMDKHIRAFCGGRGQSLHEALEPGAESPR